MKRILFELGRALRETGNQIDRIGLRAIDKPIFKEPFSRHRSVMNLFQKYPVIENNAFIAPSATVVGQVQILDSSSVWYGAVVRGDFNAVEIGAYTSVGAGAVVQSAPTADGHAPATIRIGDHVTIGPGAVLQGCTVGNEASIGAGAVVMEGALVEAGAIVAPGAVVHPDQRIPAGQVWGGNPARFERKLTPEEVASTEGNAEAHADAARDHAEMFFPEGTAYREAEGLDNGQYLEGVASGVVFTEQKPAPKL